GDGFRASGVRELERAGTCPGTAADGGGGAPPARTPARGCHRRERRRQLLFVGPPLPSLSPFPFAARAHQRRDGLWRARRRGGEVRVSRAHRDRVLGDGDFLMTGQELATAVQYGLPVILI